MEPIKAITTNKNITSNHSNNHPAAIEPSLAVGSGEIVFETINSNSNPNSLMSTNVVVHAQVGRTIDGGIIRSSSEPRSFGRGQREQVGKLSHLHALVSSGAPQAVEVAYVKPCCNNH